jgi:hypothetical protein
MEAARDPSGKSLFGDFAAYKSFVFNVGIFKNRVSGWVSSPRFRGAMRVPDNGIG